MFRFLNTHASVKPKFQAVEAWVARAEERR
jgi:hypothetical protein